ncbi:MAG: DUF952 domain-containing protein [Alphaproteobacteria bacterium]|nr:DUF952 domain-containing protein [Alphaproteobacteria bacterium]
MAQLIYHLAYADAWATALATGQYLGTADDQRDGYLHFSTAEQVRASAARHRAGRSDVVLVAVAVAAVEPWLRWEPARNGTLFPHLYCALTPAMVTWAQPLALGADGTHVFPESVAP